MNIDKESAWKQFEKSGLIRDYLLYKSNSHLDSDKLKNNLNNIFSGVSYEITRKWNNHS